MGCVLRGSFLMLEQVEKLNKWCCWVAGDVIFGAGICFRASAVTAVMGPAWALRESNRAGATEHNPASGDVVLHQYVWNKHSFGLLYFLTSAEKRGKEKANNSYTLRDFCLLFWKRNCRGESESQGKWVSCFLCVWFKAYSLPAWFHLVPVPVTLDQSLFEKRDTRGVQKIPLEEKVLHHGETSAPLIMRNEVQLEVPITGRHWEVKYSVRERESFQIFVFY